jgi:hypothetical protein
MRRQSLRLLGGSQCTPWNAARSKSRRKINGLEHRERNVRAFSRNQRIFLCDSGDERSSAAGRAGETGPAAKGSGFRALGVRMEASYRRWINWGQATRRVEQKRRWTCKRIEGGSCQG